MPIPPEGLRYTSHLIGNDQLVFLIHLPQPIESPEAYFCLISTSPSMRYFTLELGTDDAKKARTFFCEWSENGDHLNFDQSCLPIPDDFLKTICEKLELPLVCSNPEPELQKGMSKGGMVFYGDLPPTLTDAEAETENALEEQASQAYGIGDFHKAELVYKEIQKLLMASLGPTNAHATLAYQPVISALRCQKKFDEANDLASEWWQLCCLYRMLGHAETLSAMRECSRCCIDLEEPEDAMQIMKDRIRLAELTRGSDSPLTDKAREEYKEIKEQLRERFPDCQDESDHEDSPAESDASDRLAEVLEIMTKPVKPSEIGPPPPKTWDAILAGYIGAILFFAFDAGAILLWLSMVYTHNGSGNSFRMMSKIRRPTFHLFLGGRP
ncbi:MAG: hypothetical protein HQM09_24315 [Candidatus Riflebacteria bacterium]|nr:hypothetical protein [Candidatus Riflebacteria bacterium]